MKKIFSFFIVFFLIIIVLITFGCKKGTVGKTKLRLIMWTNPATVEFINDLNSKFSQKYPDIIVDVTHAPSETYEKQMRLARVTAGDVDIVAMQGLVGGSKDYSPGAAAQYWELWIKAGMLEPLTDKPFIKNYKEDAIKNASTYNGVVYTVPTGATAFSGLFYNKDLFKKYNLSVPTSFNDFLNVCETFKKNGVPPLTIAGKDIWPLSLPTQAIIGCLYPNQEEFIKSLWTNKAKFTDTKAIDVLSRMQKMMNYFEEGFQGISYITVSSRFANGLVAMLPDGVWEETKIAETKPSFEYGYFLLPGSDNAEDNKYLFGKYDLSWAVLSKSPNKDAALKWLEFFSEKDNYTTFINKVGFIPTQPDIEVDNKFIKEIASYPMKLAWDQIRIGKQSVGKYGIDVGFQVQYLQPLGDISKPEDLAKKTQSDWDDASKN